MAQPHVVAVLGIHKAYMGAPTVGGGETQCEQGMFRERRRLSYNAASSKMTPSTPDLDPPLRLPGKPRAAYVRPTRRPASQ